MPSFLSMADVATHDFAIFPDNQAQGYIFLSGDSWKDHPLFAGQGGFPSSGNRFAGRGFDCFL